VASVLDYRPSTVAVAAVLAAAHGVLTRETLESKMRSLSPSCLLDKVTCSPIHIDHSFFQDALDHETCLPDG
jgi:cyclin D5